MGSLWESAARTRRLGKTLFTEANVWPAASHTEGFVWLWGFVQGSGTAALLSLNCSSPLPNVSPLPSPHRGTATWQMSLLADVLGRAQGFLPQPFKTAAGEFIAESRGQPGRGLGCSERSPGPEAHGRV